MSLESILNALMGPDWTPPTEQEIAEREARERHEALMRRSFEYYDLRDTVRVDTGTGIRVFVLCSKQGRNRSGGDWGGQIVHAVEGGVYNGWNRAACGTLPQGFSGGWNDDTKWRTGYVPRLCSRCAAQLERMKGVK